MAIDIARRTTQTYLNEDQRWLKGGVLYAPAESILLDRTGFAGATALTTAFPNGYIPSGIFLARVTATGLFVRYDPTFDVDTATAGVQSDGRNAALGVLLTSVPYDRDSTGNIAAAMAVRCDVITNYLPTGNNLDDAARTALRHMRFFTYNV